LAALALQGSEPLITHGESLRGRQHELNGIGLLGPVQGGLDQTGAAEGQEEEDGQHQEVLRQCLAAGGGGCHRDVVTLMPGWD
jgi:hypothetical protein